MGMYCTLICKTYHINLLIVKIKVIGKNLTSIPQREPQALTWIYTVTWFRPHLHKKGVDDPQILFMTFWKIINRSSIGIRSDHPDPSFDTVTTAFVVFPCDASLTSFFLQDSSPVLLANFLCLESFSCICNVPLTFFLPARAGLVFLLQPKLLFFELFWVLVFLFVPENRIFFLTIMYMYMVLAAWSSPEGKVNTSLYLSLVIYRVVAQQEWSSYMDFFYFYLEKIIVCYNSIPLKFLEGWPKT